MTEATVHGYTVAFWVAAAIFAVGALLIGALMHGPHVSVGAAVRAH